MALRPELCAESPPGRDPSSAAMSGGKTPAQRQACVQHHGVGPTQRTRTTLNAPASIGS